MAAKQGVIRRVKLSNPNKKYTLKYSYSIMQSAKNNIVTSKYTYSKTITSTKKYSYAV